MAEETRLALNRLVGRKRRASLKNPRSCGGLGTGSGQDEAPAAAQQRIRDRVYAGAVRMRAACRGLPSGGRVIRKLLKNKFSMEEL